MWNLAQVNVGRILGSSMEDPIMKEFVEKLDEVNQLAESSPGFVWRLKDDGGNATAIPFDSDQRIIVNMSVWESLDSLQTFVYKSNHREVLMRRKEWFENMKQMVVGLWYVPIQSFPSVEDARFRLKYLREHGPTPFCFSFANKFSSDEYMIFLNEQAKAK
jgi:heme-degrading monooxygenase HmoA